MPDSTVAHLPEGVIAAAVTAVDRDLQPDAGLTASHCIRLLEAGCDGIGLLGTTGEAASFSVVQRRRLLDGMLDAGIPPGRLIVGTGAAALEDAAELTAAAARAGCVGCLVSPPYYFKSVSEQGVVDFYTRLIERTGAAAPRLYLYHFPQTTMVPVTRPVIDALLARFPGTVAGIKDSSADAGNMTGLARDYGDLAVYTGTERLMLDLRKAGGAGCIAAGANITSRVIAALDAEWKKAGDSEEARRLQQKVTALRDLFDGIPMIPAMKALLARDGQRPDWARVMPPLAWPEDRLTAFLSRWDDSGCPLP